ncbi:hypothetical protein PVAND_005011 [Polypedilum vanderplanki]|uniref:CAP-Gly domain-containing protein n=1 Tax=Polypedilum vanderplanki TaxID=319348 RepID=A0A9J6BZ05_POLVA|nr:hypothetical protein PVAND_005011 [Polypedilum vanderplanki]
MSESNEEQKSIPPSSEEYAASLILKSSKPSGIKPPSTASLFSSDSSAHRVSRICSSHQKKPDLPTAATPNKISVAFVVKHENTTLSGELSNNDYGDTMRRQSDDYKTHYLPDVSEESEYDLLYDRFGLGYRSSKSKSQSPDPFRLYKYSPDRKSSSGISSSVSPDFFEATGRRSSSDHGADLTTDTDSFMIGNRVYVGGVKPGRITFIGEVHFAPGEWAGVVLDEPEGKNDGAVSGKRYFQCEPKKGIFSRLTRLTREPLSSTTTDGPLSTDYSFRSFTSPLRNTSGNTSPTQSVSSVSKTAAGTKIIPEINDRVIVKSATGSRAGILRYRGEPAFASGIWCGVEYEEPVGKNDGSVSGQRYFKCAPNHGIFVPEGKVVLSPLARKMRLSRQNSQESLTSNITLNSLASTNTSKLRLNATQKRLSTLNKSPSATSTPKPSFSLQDILREKSNHIEQIMKERDIEREEMAAQTVLYQKNLNQTLSYLQKSPSPDVEEHIGRWATYIRQRSEHIDDLRRQFTGWTGNHERHCILHDVFLT